MISQPSNGIDVIMCPLEGEVVFVEKQNENQNDLYAVRVVLPDGSEMILRNVPIVSMFGDPLNTSRVRLRPMFVEGEEEEYILSNKDTIGERVIVQFLGGIKDRPIITARVSHPASESPFYENGKQKEDKGEPQVFFSFQGFDLKINEKGELEIIHNGSPTRSSRKLEKNKDDSNITKITIVDDGSLDIIDSKKQNIHIDTTKQFVFVGTEKDHINISLKDKDITIKTQKTVNVDTETCNVKASKLIDIVSPHIVMDSKGCKAEFKGSQYEISSPTFKLLADTSKMFELFIKNVQYAGFHPAIGFTYLGHPYLAKVIEQKTKIDTTKLGGS